jgi:hypothetical protein
MTSPVSSTAPTGSTRWTTCCAAALATGCLSTPPYQPETAVSYTPAGAGGTVAGPGFQLQFAADTAFHFPDALLIDGVDVLGHESMPGCFGEDEAGVLIAPTPRISATGSAEPVANRLVPALLGPAVVQIRLEWATRLSCNSARNPNGSSTFTVFPDGRIVRHDVVADPSPAEISANECACDRAADGSDGFTVSTFWTLARQHFVNLVSDGERLGLPAPGEAPSVNDPVACLTGNGFQIAIAWPDDMSTSVRGGNAVITFARTMMYRDSRLDAFTWDVGTAMFIERRGCDIALARADEHIAPPLIAPLRIAIDGATIPRSGRDGIFGGAGGDGEPGIALAGDRAELTGTTPGSFAVWLRFPRSTDAVRATLEGKTGPWYVPQRIDDRSWIVWFRDPIAPPQTIAIEAR